MRKSISIDRYTLAWHDTLASYYEYLAVDRAPTCGSDRFSIKTVHHRKQVDLHSSRLRVTQLVPCLHHTSYIIRLVTCHLSLVTRCQSHGWQKSNCFPTRELHQPTFVLTLNSAARNTTSTDLDPQFSIPNLDLPVHNLAQATISRAGRMSNASTATTTPSPPPDV